MKMSIRCRMQWLVIIKKIKWIKKYFEDLNDAE